MKSSYWWVWCSSFSGKAIVFLAVIAALYAQPIRGDSLQTARILIQGSPEGAEYSVNGIVASPDEYGVVQVVPGHVLLEIKRARVVMYSAFFPIDSGETRTVAFNCSDECALLHVVSEPVNATLSMNGTILGLTPYLNRFVKPGSYSIMITAPGYIPVIRRIDLSVSTEIQSYTMDRTKAVRDSLVAARLALKRSVQQKTGILFGLAGVGMIGGGAYYEWKTYAIVKEMKVAADSYDAAVTKNECDRYKQDYYKQRDLAEKPILYRSVFYGAAAVCFAGLFITFLF